MRKSLRESDYFWAWFAFAVTMYLGSILLVFPAVGAIDAVLRASGIGWVTALVAPLFTAGLSYIAFRFFVALLIVPKVEGGPDLPVGGAGSGSDASLTEQAPQREVPEGSGQ